MRIIRTLLTCTVAGFVLFGNTVLSAPWTPCDSDQLDYRPCHDSLHFCEQRINDELKREDSLGHEIDVAVYSVSTSQFGTSSGHGTVSSHLLNHVGHANDTMPSVVLRVKSPGEQRRQSIKSETNPKNNEILNSADRNTIDRLGEPQNLPAPLVAAIIALIGVVAVARRKIS